MHRVLPVIPGDSVTLGDSVRPVFTGQEAQKEKIDKCLDQSELPVLNSPGSSVQLEHNVHKQMHNMPNLQAEHWSEYSEVFQDVTNSDSSNVKRHTSFSKRTHLPHSEHQPSGIGHTGNPLGIGHTGNRSDQEHGSVRTRHHSDVSCFSGRDSNIRRNTIPLHHAEPGEHSLASMISRPARNRSRSYDSVSPRCHSRLTSRSRGKKKSHKKRKHFSTSSSSSYRSSSSSLSESERERKKHKSKKKKKKHSKSHSTKRDKSKKKHKRKRSPSPFLSPLSSSVSSHSSSSLRRSPARKKSSIASRSPSQAGVYPQSASMTASPLSQWDHLSLYADSNDEFNSHSEDAQDLVPDNTDPVLESQSESLRRTWDLLTLSKKFLNFFWPTCFLEN